MLNNLVIATLVLVVGQAAGAPSLRPITDQDSYAVYAWLLCLYVIQETEETPGCRPSRPLPDDWKDVEDDFKRQNAQRWVLRAVLPLDVPYVTFPARRTLNRHAA